MLDQMVDLIESSGYEVDPGMEVPEFLEAVETLMSGEVEMDEDRGDWLVRALHEAKKAGKKAYSLSHAAPGKSGNVHAHTKLHKIANLVGHGIKTSP